MDLVPAAHLVDLAWVVMVFVIWHHGVGPGMVSVKSVSWSGFAGCVQALDLRQAIGRHSSFTQQSFMVNTFVAFHEIL